MDRLEAARNGASRVVRVKLRRRFVRDENFFDAAGKREGGEAHIDLALLVGVEERDDLLAGHEGEIHLVQN